MEIYNLTVLKSRSLRLKGRQGHALSEGTSEGSTPGLSPQFLAVSWLVAAKFLITWCSPRGLVSIHIPPSYEDARHIGLGAHPLHSHPNL